MLIESRISFDSFVYRTVAAPVVSLTAYDGKNQTFQLFIDDVVLGLIFAFFPFYRCVEVWEGPCHAWDFFLQHRKRKGDRVIRICAWCRQEGKPGILEANPEELTKKVELESHGICYDHGLRLRQSFQKVENGRQPHTRPFALLTC